MGACKHKRRGLVVNRSYAGAANEEAVYVRDVDAGENQQGKNWVVSTTEKVGRGKERLREYLVVASSEEEAVVVLRAAPMRQVGEVVRVVQARGRVYGLGEE